MRQSAMQKDGVLTSRSRVTVRVIYSKYDCFYCIFWTADPLATKLTLMVSYHKLQCPVRKLECCVQGQGYSKSSKCQWLFAWAIASEPLNLLLLNLVCWGVILSWSVVSKDWFAVFKVTVKADLIKIWFSTIYSTILILLQPHVLSLTYIIMNWSALLKDWIAVFKGYQSFSVYVDYILWTAETLVTRHGMMMHHNEPK